MSDVLKQIYNACDPYKPATADYYCDAAAVRGSSALTRQFQRHLELSEGYLRFLFTGHVGCGKSSELEQLRRTLERPSPPHARYFPVLLDVTAYLDEFDVAPTDILLAIVSELADRLRGELGIDLKDNYFLKRFEELKDILLSDVEINEGEFSLGKAKLKVQRLKRDPAARQRVRQALSPRISSMLEEINTVFDEARLSVKKARVKGREQKYADFVLILDNLEKIERVEGRAEGLISQRELFVERAPQLTALSAHVIYTVPLPLCRSDGPQLKQRYGVEPFVLPMIKVTERGTRRKFTEGQSCLRALLQRRVGDLPLEEAITESASDFVITYSGGHVRNLMTFVREACTYAERVPIPLEAMHRAIQQTVRTYSTAIPQGHWSKLVKLDRSADQKIPGGDDDYLAMLEHLSVLEYINGGADDPFGLGEPWYAVNPIVRELQQFKASARASSEVSAT